MIENILYYGLVISSLATAAITGIKAHKLTNAFEGFDINLLNSAIDIEMMYNQFPEYDTVYIDYIKFQENVIEYININLSDYNGEITVTFSYFNSYYQCDCITYDVPCNGVRITIITDLKFYYTERIYDYEIIPS